MRASRELKPAAPSNPAVVLSTKRDCSASVVEKVGNVQAESGGKKKVRESAGDRLDQLWAKFPRFHPEYIEKSLKQWGKFPVIKPGPGFWFAFYYIEDGGRLRVK